VPTKKQRRLAPMLLGVALAAALPTAFAKDKDDAHVDSVIADSNGAVLTIQGAFAGREPPKVYLVGYASALNVLSRTSTVLQVQLPAGLTLGSHELIIGDDDAFAFTVGPVGSQGDSGATGAQGTVGINGPRGDIASLPIVSTLAPGSLDCPAGGARVTTGASPQVLCNGDDGAAGTDGKSGITGVAGAKGFAGAAGAPGAAGPRGAKGVDGAIGSAGPQGPIGDSGPQGAVGPKGVRGPFGPQGPRGPDGPVSTQPGFIPGPPGQPGAAGPGGTTGQHNTWSEGAVSYGVPYGGEATVAVFYLTPPFNTGPGDLILTLDAMAIMNADWDGCELQLKFVTGNYTSFPVSRYMPRHVARHVTYTVAVPNVSPQAFTISVVASSDCPQTQLTSMTSGGQWLNRLP
jgi:hypothetical protein